MYMKNILVTGGAGYIGSHIIELLIKKTEKILNDEKLDDNSRYLANHKIDTLRLLSLN